MKTSRLFLKNIFWMASGLLMGIIFHATWLAFYPMTSSLGSISPPEGGKPASIVESAPVRMEKWAKTFEGVGDLQAQEDTFITSEQAGVVESILFQEGDWVKKGQLLMTLQADVQKADLTAKEAEVNLALLKVERTRQLWQKGSVAKQNLDELEADLAVKKGAALAAKVRWQQTQIRAPFDGRLDLKKVSVGNYVTSGNPLVRILDTRRLKVLYQLPEEWFGRIRVGDKLTVRPLGTPFPQTAETTVDFISANVDAGTRTVLVQAHIPNVQDNRQERWGSGMSVQISQFFGAAPPSLWIPEEAVQANSERYRVFLIDEQRHAVSQVVTLGSRRAGQVMVISGLKEGDEVITRGQEKLAGGETVLVRQ